LKFEEKKQLIHEFIRLGIDKYEAVLLAECTDDEIEELNNDVTFNKRVEFNRARKEADLLEMHDEAIRIAVDKGDSKPIQWRLEVLKPDKYSKTVNKKIDANVKTEKSYSDMEEKEKERISEELLATVKKDLMKEVLKEMAKSDKC